jgi:RimJ/RimL family protein N-acetyltransferase
VAISTDPRWTDSHRVYERVGFRRVPERDFVPVPGVFLWAYVLDLVPAGSPDAAATRISRIG